MKNSTQKRKYTRRQPVNVNTHDEPQAGGNASVIQPDSEVAHKVVAIRQPKGGRKNIFETSDVPVSEDAGHKLIASQEARQLLAQAKDLWSKGAEFEGEAKDVSARAALLLTTMRLSGDMSADEISGALGDQFGYKPKKDGSPSKTPNGQGEALRKRIVRLAAANDHVHGINTEGFFKGCPEDKVADVLNGTINGTIGFWNAYERFAEIKRELQVPVPLAFNVKRISEIAEKLQEAGSAEKFIHNPELRRAYAQLWAIIRVVGEEAASLASKAA